MAITLNDYISHPSTDVIGSVAWHPSGRYFVLCGSTSPRIHVFAVDGETFTEVVQPINPSITSRTVAFSPDGTTIVGSFSSTTNGISDYALFFAPFDPETGLIDYSNLYTGTTLTDTQIFSISTVDGITWYIAVNNLGDNRFSAFKLDKIAGTVTRLTVSGDFPTNGVISCAVTPDQQYLIAIVQGDVHVYEMAHDSSTGHITLTEVIVPSSVGTVDTHASIGMHPTGNYFYANITGPDTSYNLVLYKKNGSDFTTINLPAGPPVAAQGGGVDWSVDGNNLVFVRGGQTWAYELNPSTDTLTYVGQFTSNTPTGQTDAKISPDQSLLLIGGTAGNRTSMYRTGLGPPPVGVREGSLVFDTFSVNAEVANPSLSGNLAFSEYSTSIELKNTPEVFPSDVEYPTFGVVSSQLHLPIALVSNANFPNYSTRGLTNVEVPEYPEIVGWKSRTFITLNSDVQASEIAPEHPYIYNDGMNYPIMQFSDEFRFQAYVNPDGHNVPFSYSAFKLGRSIVGNWFVEDTNFSYPQISVVGNLNNIKRVSASLNYPKFNLKDVEANLYTQVNGDKDGAPIFSPIIYPTFSVAPSSLVGWIIVGEEVDYGFVFPVMETDFRISNFHASTNPGLVLPNFGLSDDSLASLNGVLPSDISYPSFSYAEDNFLQLEGVMPSSDAIFPVFEIEGNGGWIDLNADVSYPILETNSDLQAQGVIPTDIYLPAFVTSFEIHLPLGFNTDIEYSIYGFSTGLVGFRNTLNGPFSFIGFKTAGRIGYTASADVRATYPKFQIKAESHRPVIINPDNLAYSYQAFTASAQFDAYFGVRQSQVWQAKINNFEAELTTLGTYRQLLVIINN